MIEPISATHQHLLQQYGPLLTLEHVAELLHSSPGSLRMGLSRRSMPLMIALAQSQRREGRRIYFQAKRVAEILDGEDPAARKNPDAVSAQRRPRLSSRNGANS